MNRPNKIDVGQRIRMMRLDIGLSMSQFAKEIDEIAKSRTVNNWEHGKNLTNRKRTKRIAVLVGMTIEYLLYGSKCY